MQFCERCQKRFDGWQISRAELRVGGIHRLPMLCSGCRDIVEVAIINALNPMSAPSAKEGE